MRIICSGGGTGGHIFPAIAVAQFLKKKHPDSEILFIGAKGKMEMTKVPKAGFPIKGLWISGFQRSLTLKNVLFPLKLIISLTSAFRIVRKFNPDVVAGFGGYASGAALWVASKLRIPTLILEQNSYPGITNKLLNGHADTVCIAYEEARPFFNKSNTVLTGNPVREVLKKQSDRNHAIEVFGLDKMKKTILIIGGSLGAKSLNEAIENNYDQISDLKDTQILWQCGGGYIEKYKDARVANLLHVQILPFIDDMASAYAVADIVVCRAGALSIAELMLTSKAAILVPSPNVAEDHQTKNAQALADQNAAILLPDQMLSDLVATARALLDDEGKRRTLSKNIHQMSHPDAVSDIVNELEKLIDK